MATASHGNGAYNSIAPNWLTPNQNISSRNPAPFDLSPTPIEASFSGQQQPPSYKTVSKDHIDKGNKSVNNSIMNFKSTQPPLMHGYHPAAQYNAQFDSTQYQTNPQYNTPRDWANHTDMTMYPNQFNQLPHQHQNTGLNEWSMNWSHYPHIASQEMHNMYQTSPPLQQQQRYFNSNPSATPYSSMYSPKETRHTTPNDFNELSTPKHLSEALSPSITGSNPSLTPHLAPTTDALTSPLFKSINSPQFPTTPRNNSSDDRYSHSQYRFIYLFTVVPLYNNTKEPGVYIPI